MNIHTVSDRITDLSHNGAQYVLTTFRHNNRTTAVGAAIIHKFDSHKIDAVLPFFRDCAPTLQPKIDHFNGELIVHWFDEKNPSFVPPHPDYYVVDPGRCYRTMCPRGFRKMVREQCVLPYGRIAASGNYELFHYFPKQLEADTYPNYILGSALPNGTLILAKDQQIVKTFAVHPSVEWAGFSAAAIAPDLMTFAVCLPRNIYIFDIDE